MLKYALAFLCGILLLQQFTQLPATSSFWFMSILLVVSVFILIKKYLKLLIIFLLGFGWALTYVNWQSVWRLPDALEGRTVVIEGYIASIPNTTSQQTTFLFSLKTINQQPAHGLLRLHWRSKHNLKAGDAWQFTVRLKRIHSLLNPGSFDEEANALQTDVRASGNIIKPGNLLLSHWYHYPLTRIRQYFKIQIENLLPVSQTSPWIVALAVGERQNIAAEQWQILRNTGTNHLMAIAGLHIGMLAGVAHFCIAGLWRRIPRLTLKLPAQQAGAIAALCLAILYSALAGFSIPTQRACIMLSIFLSALLLRRQLSIWHSWSCALMIVLIMNPLDVLTESFWLSFSSIALIIYGVSKRLRPTGIWWKYGRIQWVIAVGLIPFSICLFKQFSCIAFIANLIAIPWVAFCVVPLTLLGLCVLLCSQSIGGSILWLADKMLGLLWVILTYLSHLSFAVWDITVPFWMILIAVVGMLILLIPSGFPGRWLGMVGFLPMIFYQAPTPRNGEVWLTLLDVGQGLAAVVQTHKHILIFDAGPRLNEHFDMGENIVLPFLHTLNKHRVDMLVISHGDNDHIGGAGAILKNFAVLRIKSSVPEKFTLPASLCLRGERWQWDKVDFKFLYPTLAHLNLNNDSSCVLKISSGKQHILFTGDIEKSAETYLLEQNVSDLAATILIAPHHGSKTSALDEFVAAVAPKYVLFATGYRNRYHFPHEVVMQKYQALGAHVYDTAKVGAIQIHLNAHTIQSPILYRFHHAHYWNSIF